LALIGAMMLALAGLMAAAQYYFSDGWLDHTAFTFGVMLVLLGGGLVVLGGLGRRFGGFLAAGLTLALVGLPVVETISGAHRRPSAEVYVGELEFVPMDADEAEAGFWGDAGDLMVDLTTHAILAERDVTTEIQLEAGEADLMVPDDVPVTINARISAGEISADKLDPALWEVRIEARPGAGGANEAGGIGVNAVIVSKTKVDADHPHALTVNFQGRVGNLEIWSGPSWGGSLNDADSADDADSDDDDADDDDAGKR
jgi:hypothetical protein